METFSLSQTSAQARQRDMTRNVLAAAHDTCVGSNRKKPAYSFVATVNIGEKSTIASEFRPSHTNAFRAGR